MQRQAELLGMHFAVNVHSASRLYPRKPVGRCIRQFRQMELLYGL